MTEESGLGNAASEIEEISAGIAETLAFVERWKHSPGLREEKS